MYLWDAVNAQLVIYDRDSQEVLASTDVLNDFYYSFNSLDSFITAGNSITLGFHLLKVSDGAAVSLLALPSDAGLFPLASSGDLHLFTLSTFGERLVETERRVVAWDGDALALVPVGDISGIITGGAIVGDKLYYTTLVDGRSYSLKVVQLGVETATPTLVEEGLLYPDVYSFRGELLKRVDDGRVVAVPDVGGAASSWECPVACFFLDEVGLVLSLAGGVEAPVHGVVYDGFTATPIGTVRDVVGATVSDSGLTVYGWHDMVSELKGSEQPT
jgi:hypothetical protein